MYLGKPEKEKGNKEKGYWCLGAKAWWTRNISPDYKSVLTSMR